MTMNERLSRRTWKTALDFVVARPQESEESLAFYRTLKFESNLANSEKILRPNETVMIELQLRRWVDTAVFQLSNERDPKNTELLRKEPIDKKRRKKDVQ